MIYHHVPAAPPAASQDQFFVTGTLAAPYGTLTPSGPSDVFVASDP